MWPFQGHSPPNGGLRPRRELACLVVILVIQCSSAVFEPKNRTLGRSATDFPSSANVLTTNFASLKNTTFKISASKKYYMKYASSTTTSQGPTSTTSGTTSTTTTVRTTVKPAQTSTVKVTTTSFSPPPPPKPLVSPSPAPSPKPMYGEKIKSVVVNSSIVTAAPMPKPESLVRDQMAQGSDVMINVMVAPPLPGRNQQRREDFTAPEQNYEKFGVQDSLLYQHQIGGPPSFRESQQSPGQFGGPPENEVPQFHREKIQRPGESGFNHMRDHSAPPQPISGGGYQFPQNGLHVINPVRPDRPPGLHQPLSNPSLEAFSPFPPRPPPNIPQEHHSPGFRHHGHSLPHPQKEFDAVSAINPVTKPWQPSAPIYPGPIYPGHSRPTRRSDRLGHDNHHQQHTPSPFGPMKSFGPPLGSSPGFSGSFSAGDQPQRIESPSQQDASPFAPPPPPGPPRSFDQLPPKIQSPLENIRPSDVSSAALSGVGGDHNRLQAEDQQSQEPEFVSINEPPVLLHEQKQKNEKGFSLSSLEQGFGDFSGFKGSSIPGSESSQVNSEQDDSDSFKNLGGIDQSHRAPKALREPSRFHSSSFHDAQSNLGGVENEYPNALEFDGFQNQQKPQKHHGNGNQGNFRHNSNHNQAQFSSGFKAGNFATDSNSGFGPSANSGGASDSQSVEGGRPNGALEPETVTPSSVGLSDEITTGRLPEGRPSSEDIGGNSQQSPLHNIPPQISFDNSDNGQISHQHHPQHGHRHPSAFVHGQVIQQNFETSTQPFSNFPLQDKPEHDHRPETHPNHFQQAPHSEHFSPAHPHSQFEGQFPGREFSNGPSSHKNRPQSSPDFSPFYIDPFNGPQGPQQSHSPQQHGGFGGFPVQAHFNHAPPQHHHHNHRAPQQPRLPTVNHGPHHPQPNPQPHQHFDSRHHYQTGSLPRPNSSPVQEPPHSNNFQSDAPGFPAQGGFNEGPHEGFPPAGVDFHPGPNGPPGNQQNTPIGNEGFGPMSQEHDPGHPGFQDFGNFPSKHAHLVINPNGEGAQNHPGQGLDSNLHHQNYQPPQVVSVESPPEVVTFQGPPQPGFQETETSASLEHPSFAPHDGFPGGFPGFDSDSSPFHGEPHHHPGSDGNNQLDELVKHHPGLGPDDSSILNVPGAGFVGQHPSGNVNEGPSFGPPAGFNQGFGPPGGSSSSFGPPGESRPSFGPPGGSSPSFGPGGPANGGGSQGNFNSPPTGGIQGFKQNAPGPIGHHHPPSNHQNKLKKFPVYKKPTLAVPNLRSVALSPLKFLTSFSKSALSSPLKLISNTGRKPITPFHKPAGFPSGFNQPVGPVKGLPQAIAAPIKALNPVKHVVGGLKQLVNTPVKVVKVVKEVSNSHAHNRPPLGPFKRPSFGIGHGGGPLRGLGGLLQGVLNGLGPNPFQELLTTPSIENAMKLASKLGHKILSFYAKHSIPRDHYLRVISFAGIYLLIAWIFKDSEHILYPKCESWGWNPPQEFTFHAPARFVPAPPVDPHLQQEFLNLFRGLENCLDEKVALKIKKKKKKDKKRKKKEHKKKRDRNRNKKKQENRSSSEEDEEEDDENDSVEDDYGHELGFINDMCPRDNFFYGMSPRHIESWTALARLFVQQKSPADVLHLAKSLLYEHRVNPKVWYLGLQAAAMQRPDMTGFSLAHPLDALPDMFLPGHLIEGDFARYSMRSGRVKRSTVKLNGTLSPSKAVKIVRRTSHGIKLRTNVTTTTTTIIPPTSTGTVVLEKGHAKGIAGTNGTSEGSLGNGLIKRSGDMDDEDSNEDDEIDEDDDSEDGEHRNRRKKHPLGYGHGFVGDGYGKYKQKQANTGGIQGVLSGLGGLLNGGGGQGGGLFGGNNGGGLFGGNKGEDGEDNGNNGQGQGGQNGQGGGLLGGNRDKDKKKEKGKGKKKKKEKKKCIVVDGSVGLDNGIENKLWYWREDLMVNQHHWYWHQTHPLNSSMHADRRAELFFYMHRNLLARYNAERLSNGFSRTLELGLYPGAIIDEPYNPHLKDFNSGAWWAARGPHTAMQDIRHMKDPDFQRDVVITDVVALYNSFVRAIQLGFLINRDGRFLPIRFHEGINPLANTVDASNISVNPFYYDAFGLHNLGHVILALSADPDYSNHLPSGVMGETATSMRDPVFYTYHTVLDNLFDKFKQTLAPYKPYGGVWPLQWHGVDVLDVKLVPHDGSATNSLTTFYIKHKFQLEPGVDRSIEKGIEKAEVCAVHLDHAPFQFQIVIDKKKCAKSSSGQGTVRIFMAPRYDEEGHRLPLVEQRRLMFQLDAFQVELKLGRNLITRNSRDNALTKPWSRSLNDYQRGSNPAGGADYCGCGWPHHLFIPKGNTHGMPFDLFVMVTNFDEDFVADNPMDMEIPERCNSPYIFCGLPRRRYPDGRPMGYPFDRPPHHVPAQPCGSGNGFELKDLLCKLTGRLFTRPVGTLEEYVSLATNMAMTTFEIKHIPKVVGKHYG